MDKEYKSGYIYINDDYFKNTKEVFKFISSEIEENVGSSEFDILDCCCARGEFLYHVSQKFNNASAMQGFDFDPELIKSGDMFDGIKGNNIALSVNDATNFDFEKKDFDIITIIGSISVFDDLVPVYQNISKHLKKGGKVFTLAKINHFGMNVHIQYQNHVMEKDWQTSNYHSIEYMNEVFSKTGLSFDYEKQFDYCLDDKPKEDPLRAWTVEVDGKKCFMNGMGSVYDLTLLVAKKD